MQGNGSGVVGSTGEPGIISPATGSSNLDGHAE
jgi:hypothetical protein